MTPLTKELQLTKEQTARLPRAEVETAWDLCEATCRAILDEPRRYDQDNWVLTGAAAAERIGSFSDEPSIPACGTVGCRAGWMTAIWAASRFPEEVAGQIIAGCSGRLGAWTDVARAAAALLGDGDAAPARFGRALQNLFDGSALLEEELDRCERAGQEMTYTEARRLLPRLGTPEYARLGEAGLREFMARFEGYLRSVRLDDADVRLDGVPPKSPAQ